LQMQLSHKWLGLFFSLQIIINFHFLMKLAFFEDIAILFLAFDFQNLSVYFLELVEDFPFLLLYLFYFVLIRGFVLSFEAFRFFNFKLGMHFTLKWNNFRLQKLNIFKRPFQFDS
jgi:hypothetical protein